MSKIVQAILHLWAVASQKDYKAKRIALHIAQNTLYENKGIDTLYPDLKDKYLLLAERMKDLNIPIYFVEGFRTIPRQNSLSKGVTNAGGLQSYHQYGLAFDVTFVGLRWDAPKNYWDTLGRQGKALGLNWGGEWGDYGHFELPGFDWKELKPYFER